MGTTWQQQALALAREDMELSTDAPTIEGPGMVAIWVQVVSRWYVIEQSERVWWTNDRTLVEQGEGLGAITEEEDEDA